MRGCGYCRRTPMSRYAFLVETYRTERLKILGVWSQVPDDRMGFRPEPRARTPLEHMVHQCQSEDGWMRSMLGIDISQPVLPAIETRDEFIRHYAVCSDVRLKQLETQSDSWFEAPASFFGETRSRAWVLTRRMTHSAHHRGQLTIVSATLGPAAVLDVRSDRRHRRPAEERRTRDLSVRVARGVVRHRRPRPGRACVAGDRRQAAD